MSDGPHDHDTYDHERFCDALADGATLRMACRMGRVPTRTVQYWESVANGTHAALLTDEVREHFEAWRLDVADAQETGRGSQESWIVQHAQHDPQTARWLLARLDPENYADLGKRRSRAAERRVTEAEERVAEAEAREAEARARIRELELALAEAQHAAAMDPD